jgi:hypothetical protein
MRHSDHGIVMDEKSQDQRDLRKFRTSPDDKKVPVNIA